MRRKMIINICFMLALATTLTSAIADQIECTFDINDSRKTLTLYPSEDVFTSTKINLPGGFRFAGQYLSKSKIFKAYVYHTPKERYVLLALQSFVITEASCSQDFGQHRVYDSEDERELYFHCRKKCTQ